MTSPGRSLEHVTVGVNDAGEPVLTCLCDCGSVCEIVIAGVQGDGGAVREFAVREFAYTCDGCQTSHWITITVAAGGE